MLHGPEGCGECLVNFMTGLCTHAAHGEHIKLQIAACPDYGCALLAPWRSAHIHSSACTSQKNAQCTLATAAWSKICGKQSHRNTQATSSHKSTQHSQQRPPIGPYALATHARIHTCAICTLSDVYASARLPHMLCFVTHMPRLGMPPHTSAFFQTCTDKQCSLIALSHTGAIPFCHLAVLANTFA